MRQKRRLVLAARPKIALKVRDMQVLSAGRELSQLWMAVFIKHPKSRRLVYASAWLHQALFFKRTFQLNHKRHLFIYKLFDLIISHPNLICVCQVIRFCKACSLSLIHRVKTRIQRFFVHSDMGPSTDDYHHRRLREVALAYRLQLEDLRRGTLDTISTLPGRSIILPGRRMSSDPSAPSGANSTSTPAQSSDLGQQSNLPHAPIQPLLDRLNVLSQSSTSGNFGMEGSKAPPSQHTSDQYSVDPPTYRSSFSSSTSTITTGGSQPIPPHQPATHTQSDGYQHYPAHRPPSFTPLPPSADRQQSYEYTLPHWLPGSSQTNQSNLPSTYPAYNDHHLTSFYPRTELFPAHRTPARLSHNEIPSPPTLGPISSYEYNTFHTPRSNDQSLYSALGPESSLDLNDTALTSPITAGQYGYEDTPRFPAIRPPVRTRPSSTNNTVTISALATYGYPTPRPSASFPGSAYWITPNPYTGPETDTNSYRYDAAQYTPTVTTNNLVGFQSGPYRPGLNDGFGMGVEIIVGLGLQHTPMSSAIEGMSGYGQLLPGPGVPARSWKGMSMGSFDGLFGQPNIIPDQAGSSAIGLSPSQEAFSYVSIS